MKHLPLIVSFVLLALLVTCDGRAEEPPEAGPKAVAIDALQQKQLDDVLLQFGQLRQQLDREHLVLDTNTATLADATRQVSALTESLERLWRQEQVIQTTLDRFQMDSEAARRRTKMAATLILVGMLVEILGGTMLAGAYISAKQMHIATLRASQPLRDLALRDTQYEPILNFFGVIGGLVLVLGFFLQFTGTLITSSLPLAIRFLIATVAVVGSLGLFGFFLGQTPEQTRRDKLSVLAHNLKRPFWRLAARIATGTQAIECEVCLHLVPIDQLHVWWLYEENSETHLYLHTPYAFHYGHDDCLLRCDDFGVFFNVPGKYKSLRLGKASAIAFAEDTVPPLHAWYMKFHEYWTKEREQPSQKTAHEEQLDRVYDRIAPVVRRRRTA